MFIEVEKNKKRIEKTLYDTDFYLWIETTVQQLEKKQFNELDLTNLIEEIADMGRQAKQSLKSNLRVLLMHLIKYKYQPEKRSRSWLLTISEHRQRIFDSLEDSPSLKNYYLEIFNKCYQNSRKNAAIETGLNLNLFPEICPFNLDEVLDENFLPESKN